MRNANDAGHPVSTLIIAKRTLESYPWNGSTHRQQRAVRDALAAIHAAILEHESGVTPTYWDPQL